MCWVDDTKVPLRRVNKSTLLFLLHPGGRLSSLNLFICPWTVLSLSMEAQTGVTDGRIRSDGFRVSFIIGTFVTDGHTWTYREVRAFL